jgi:hypothetical protein
MEGKEAKADIASDTTEMKAAVEGTAPSVTMVAVSRDTMVAVSRDTMVAVPAVEATTMDGRAETSTAVLLKIG